MHNQLVLSRAGLYNGVQSSQSCSADGLFQCQGHEGTSLPAASLLGLPAAPAPSHHCTLSPQRALQCRPLVTRTTNSSAALAQQFEQVAHQVQRPSHQHLHAAHTAGAQRGRLGSPRATPTSLLCLGFLFTCTPRLQAGQGPAMRSPSHQHAPPPHPAAPACEGMASPAHSAAASPASPAAATLGSKSSTRVIVSCSLPPPGRLPGEYKPGVKGTHQGRRRNAAVLP